MDLDSGEGADTKTEFRKPGNDAANRKYRRRSPGGGSSSSSDGSPLRKRSLIPDPSRKDNSKISDDKQKRDDTRNHTGQCGESFRHSERKSPRSYHRHNDQSRRERYAEDYDRGYSRSSSRSWRESRDDLDHTRGDKEHQRDYSRSKYDSGYKNRDSYDRLGFDKRQDKLEERDRYREKDRHREDRGERYGESDRKKGNRDERGGRSTSIGENIDRLQGVNSGHNLREDSSRDDKEPSERHVNEDSKEQSNDRTGADQESVAKKSKFSSSDSAGLGNDVSGSSEQDFVTDADIDAAKLAAMKAAEMVNRNLVGTGYMSADQKKKLLWGSKKSNTTEEPAKRWDSTIFVDRERQEKFNKLMGVKGDAKVDLKSDNVEVEKQREQLQMELEKQYTAGLRRRDGRTVGLGL